MLIERKWKTWVYFYIPLTVFVVGTLFPFYWMLITAIRPDAELYRSWRAATNTPFWTPQPTLQHFRDLDRKSTRLNSSHGYTSYSLFFFKKKNTTDEAI